MSIQNAKVQFKYYDRSLFNALPQKEANVFYIVKETDGNELIYRGSNLLSYKNLSDFNNDSKFATEDWVTSKNYLTNHQSLANYVTLDTTQTITGKKTFSNLVTLNDELFMKNTENFNNIYIKKTFLIGSSGTSYTNLSDEIKNGGYHRFWRISFPETSDAKKINFWGRIKITLYGTYASFNASGVMSKEINCNFNHKTMYSNVGRYLDLSGYVEKDFRISEAIWNETNSCWEFLIYSHSLAGNNFPYIIIEGWASNSQQIADFKNMTFTVVPEFLQDTTYNNVKGNAAGQTLIKTWADLPVYETPYGEQIATKTYINDEISSIPSGTLNSTKTTTLVPSSSEALTGNIELHKVSKTGSYNDLLNKPTIPTVPTISTNIVDDATSDIKTTSPKAVKTYADNKYVYLTVDTAYNEAAKVTNETVTFESGKLYFVRFTKGTSIASPTLNGINIRLGVTNASTTTLSIANGSNVLVAMYYDDENDTLQLTGSYRTSDSTESYTLRLNTSVIVGEQVTRYKLLVPGADGKYYPTTVGNTDGNTKVVNTVPFVIGQPILFYGATATVNANNTVASSSTYTGFVTANTGRTWNQNSGWTPHQMVYLKGSISNNTLFTLDTTTSTSHMTQTLPTSEDGFYYMLLGIMRDATTSFRLLAEHPIYYYKNGNLRLFDHFPDNMVTTNTTQTIPGDKTFNNISINGNLTVAGTTTTVNSTNLEISDKIITIAKDNNTELTNYAGFVIPKFDGTSTLGLLMNKDGELRVGKVQPKSSNTNEYEPINNSLQPLLTRSEKASLIDNDVMVWDSSMNQAKGVSRSGIDNRAAFPTTIGSIGGITNWKTFYTDGFNSIKELALGKSGYVLKSNGTSSAPSWEEDNNTVYTAGTNITISNDTISAKDTTYEAGNDIEIISEDNSINVSSSVTATASSIVKRDSQGNIETNKTFKAEKFEIKYNEVDESIDFMFI